MNRFLLSLAGFLAAGWLPGSLTPAHADDRPNVLFIISDDLNTRLGCYGDGQVRSPHIDALAARGVRFDQAYCQYPLCGPSRNSMLTGLYPDQTGILENATIFRQTIPDHVSLPQAFRRAGYLAVRIGKLYHYGVPRSIGTNGNDDPASWEIEINPAGCDRLIEQPDIFSLREGKFGGTLSWYASPRPDQQHTDGMMADEACWMLDRFASRPERPFFLAVGMFRPHTPFVAPEKYFEPYPLDDMPVLTGDAADPGGFPAAALKSHKREHDLLTPALTRECIQAYYASTSFMDAQVGKILTKLEQTGLGENTIVVFTSDHGYHLGEKGLWQKMSLYEPSARVPLIIAAPGKSAGDVSASPVGLVDLYPTLTELCDVPRPSPVHGQSLASLLDDPTLPGRGWTLSQVRRKDRGERFMGYSLRTARHRLTLWDEGRAGVELYDYQSDPTESVNLADDPGMADVRDRLSELLSQAIEQAQPAEPMPETVPRPYLPILVSP